MTDKKSKRKPERREIKVVVQPPRPNGDLFNPFKIAKEAESPTHPPPTTHHPPPTTQPIAPERDFVRVPNSVVRDALPGGLFKGESKKTYDALYQRTRGAVVPRRMLRATLAEVMAWASVSHNTLKAHLKHLTRVGLVRVHYVRGDNTGADYEILTPEEVPPTTHHPPTSHPPATSQNLAPPTSQNLVVGGGGQILAVKEDTADDKTSFKTNTERDDDEALAPLLALLRQAVREVTGREPSASEAARWRELGELLVTELKIAAGRTTVSSVPAFLTEHLRRRLWKKDQRQVEEEGKSVDSGQPGAAKADALKCPDCFGTGMWYPEGFEKGVSRCRHEKLLAEAPKQAD